jgi:hypothetical protein
MKRFGPVSNQANFYEGVITMPANGAMGDGETDTVVVASAVMGLFGGEIVLVGFQDDAVVHVPDGIVLQGKVVSMVGTNPLQTQIWIQATNCRGTGGVNMPAFEVRYVVIPKQGTVSPP